MTTHIACAPLTLTSLINISVVGLTVSSVTTGEP